MKKATIIGGGFAGCTWAHILGNKGWEVTLIESADVLGGGCRTLYWGGHPYTYGPRHLFTPHGYVYDWLHERVPQRRLDHYLLTYVERDGEFYSYPIHADDIEKMPDVAKIRDELARRPDVASARNFEEGWIYSVGPTLYDKYVKSYSKKMWQLPDNSLITDFRFDGKGIQIQNGTHQVRKDWHVSYPTKLNGWDDFFEIARATPNVKTMLNTRIEAFDVEKSAVKIKGEWLKSDILVSSISPDTLMDQCYGELKYVGRDFMTLVLPVKQVIPDPTFFIHYANQEQFTRVVEYKKLTGYESNSTLLGIEIPSFKNKLYPYPTKDQQDLADRYFKDFPDHVYSVGRMGNYRYRDIANIVEEALAKTKDL